jgi:hypothetical protein
LSFIRRGSIIEHSRGETIFVPADTAISKGVLS